MKTKICCFAGHASIYNKSEIKMKLRDAIIELITHENVHTFYSGGKGNFDRLRDLCLYELKIGYIFIKHY